MPVLHWQIFNFAYDRSWVGSVSSLSFILSFAVTREQMLIYAIYFLLGLCQYLSRQKSACSAGIMVFDPWVGRSPGGGNGNTLQYSCLENPMDRGAWWATVHGIPKSQIRLKWHSIHTTYLQSTWAFHSLYIFLVSDFLVSICSAFKILNFWIHNIKLCHSILIC